MCARHGYPGWCPQCSFEDDQKRRHDYEQVRRRFQLEQLAYPPHRILPPPAERFFCPSCKGTRIEKPAGAPALTELQMERLKTTKMVCIQCLHTYCPHFIRWDRPKPCLDCLADLYRMWKSVPLTPPPAGTDG